MATATNPAQQQETLRQGLETQHTTWAKQVWRRFRKNKAALLGAVVLAILILVSVLAPVITANTTGWGRDEIDIKYTLVEPSARHPLGTDSVGRDTWTRLLYGGRVSLAIAATAVVAYMAVGIVVGALSGYFGGWIDNILMRIADVVLSFPFIPFILTLSAIFRPGVEILILTIALVSWPEPARLVRGEFLSLRERDFIEAARATGASPMRIMFRHLLPNAMAPLIVSATLNIAGIILLESALSYLGFGVKAPTPTWGNMLSEVNNMAVLTRMPWLWLPPGLMIFLTVLSINFVGDGLRDALDPRLKQ